jgi:hypothetical protein
MDGKASLTADASRTIKRVISPGAAQTTYAASKVMLRGIWYGGKKLLPKTSKVKTRPSLTYASAILAVLGGYRTF